MGILIKNGSIIDGTGSPQYKSELLIENEEIKEIGPNLASNGNILIDATSKIIAPGFIDMHSHADLTILQIN